MIGYLLQFLAMASFGLSNCFWSEPLKRIPVFLLIAIRSAITSTIFLLLILLQSGFHFSFLENFYTPVSNLTFIGILISVLICSVNYFGLFFFTKSIKYGTVSLSIPVLSVGAISGVIIGIIFYKQPFNASLAIAGLLFILGLWFLEKLNPQMWRLRFTKSVGFSLLAALFWSTSAFSPVGIKYIGVLNFSFILEITVCVISVIAYVFQHHSRDFSNQIVLLKDLQSVILLALFTCSGVLCLNLAYTYLPVTVLALFGIVQPVVSILFAGYLLKERLSYVQYIGVGIILVGVVVLKF